ncbi:MAG: YjgN family protein [Alphaproteobacteria bacterium]
MSASGTMDAIGTGLAEGRTGSDGPVAFTGGRGPLFRILVKNSVFNLLTLGIYRFWAKTWLRRYLWHNIAIRGEALEYTGRPAELLIGFLIAMAVLVPLAMVVGILDVAFLGGRSSEDASFGQLIYLIALLWLANFARYRVRRYKLTRTAWRGIRGGLDGSAVRYAWLAFGAGLLTVATAGLARPWMRTALQRYKTENSRYGIRNFSFAGKGSDLFARWLVVLVFLLLSLILFVWWMVAFTASIQGELGRDNFAAAPSLVVPALVGLGGLALLALSYMWYRVYEFRYFIGKTRLGDTCFDSDVRTSTILRYGSISGIVQLFLIIAIVFLASMAVAPMLSGISVSSEAIGALILPFLLVILVFTVVRLIVHYLLFYFPLARHVCVTLHISNLEAVEDIIQSTRADPKFGEGLADALDIDIGPV